MSCRVARWQDYMVYGVQRRRTTSPLRGDESIAKLWTLKILYRGHTLRVRSVNVLFTVLEGIYPLSNFAAAPDRHTQIHASDKNQYCAKAVTYVLFEGALANLTGIMICDNLAVDRVLELNMMILL